MSPWAMPLSSRKRAMAAKSVRAFSSARGSLKIEIDEASVGERAQLLGNRVVLLLDRRNLPVKATHRALSTGGGDRIGQREPSRHHQRQTQAVFGDGTLLQFRVDECLR